MKYISIQKALDNNIIFYIIIVSKDEEDWGYINSRKELEPWDISTGGCDYLDDMLLFLNKKEAEQFLENNKQKNDDETLDFQIGSFILDKESVYSNLLSKHIGSLTNHDIEWL